MEIVLVLAYNRPEFLEVCLNKICCAYGFEEHTYVFQVDRDCRMNDELIRNFAKVVPNCYAFRSQAHSYQGNGYNATLGYKNAYQIGLNAGARIAHLIEDDIFIGEDYFNFHKQAWELNKGDDFYFVSACLNQQESLPVIRHPKMCYLSPKTQTLGVSFKLSAFKEFAEFHNRRYFENPIAYLRQKFPFSTINPNHAEQAGVVRRIVESKNQVGLYPFYPRAYHAGVYGQNQTSQVFFLKPEQLETMQANDFKKISKTGLGFNTEIYRELNQSGLKIAINKV